MPGSSFRIINLRNKLRVARDHEQRVLRRHIRDKQRREEVSAPVAVFLQSLQQLCLAFPELIETNLLDLRHTESHFVLFVFLQSVVMACEETSK
jgi:hypothetical protein